MKETKRQGSTKISEKNLNHDLFGDCVLSKDKVLKKMTQLRLHCHRIAVNEVDKVAVSSFDDKRFILENGVSSFVYGH